jgi:putative transposase
MIQLTQQLAATIGTAPACQELAVPRSSYYRAQQPPAAPVLPVPRSVHPTPPRALSTIEKERVREVLNSERFQDQAPREVYATLLDEETYFCHWRTMYRVLDEYQEVRERRNQLRHPVYAKPELLATHPNQLWSWDITKLRGPSTWIHYYLYVILDVYSRCVVGWLLAERESEELAKQLIDETCLKHGIPQGATEPPCRQR